MWQKQYTLGNNASDIIIHHSYGQIFGPEEAKNKGGKTTPMGMMDRGFTVYETIKQATSKQRCHKLTSAQGGTWFEHKCQLMMLVSFLFR